MDRSVQLFRFDARVVDALHAIGALFHHAAAAHGDFRITQKLELRCLPILEAQEVEAAHFVRTVVRAVARSDTAVIDHVVQAFGAVHRGSHRADLLAGGVLTLLAGNRLEKRWGIEKRLIVAGRIVRRRPNRLFVIAVDTDPVHFAAAHHLILADHGDVVLRLAGDHASVAAIAFVQVDGHRPLVSAVGEFRLPVVERQFLERRFGMLVGKIRILAILRERAGGQDLPAFHAEVILRASERIILAGFFDGAAGGGGRPKRVRSAHGVGIETLVRAGVARLLAAVSQRQDHDAIGLARQPPRGSGDFAVRKRNVNDVRINLAVLPATRPDVVRQAQLSRCLGADQRGIVPGELGDRLWQFLQPAVIGETPVVDARIGAEDEFKIGRGSGFWRRQTRGSESEGGTDRGISRTRNEPIVQRFAPEFFGSTRFLERREVGGLPHHLRVGAQRIIIANPRLVAECGKHFAGGMRVIQRRDQRLNHAERAVESARISPGFEVVRFGDVPVAKFGGLVKV